MISEHGTGSPFEHTENVWRTKITPYKNISMTDDGEFTPLEGIN